MASFTGLRDHTQEAPHSLGLLWMSDQPHAETSLPDNTQHSQETNIDVPGEIRSNSPSKKAAADPRFRLRGYWGRFASDIQPLIYVD